MAISNSNSEKLTDEELAALYLADENEQALLALFGRYRALAKSRANRFCNTFCEAEDLEQEAMLGVYGAVLSYKSEKASFATFARICIDRRLISCVRARCGTGKIPEELMCEYNDELKTYSEDSNNPEELLARADEYALLSETLKKQLSSLEYSVITELLGGLSYQEIAKKLSVSAKSVDNAVQRIRKKLKKQNCGG